MTTEGYHYEVDSVRRALDILKIKHPDEPDNPSG